jgi:hypothetical protein
MPRSDGGRTRPAQHLSGRALALCRRLAKDRKGALVIIFALIIPVLIGALGLGIEFGMWYLEKRRMQEAADSGAMHGAFQFRADPTLTKTTLVPHVTMAVGQSGYSVTPVVEKPPLRGRYTSAPTAVEVTLNVDHPTYFIGWFGINTIPIQSRAVAMEGDGVADACILALGNYCATSTAKDPISISGNALLNLEECGIHANGSQCPTSMDLSGSTITGATCVGGVNTVEYGTYCGDPLDPANAGLPGCGSGSAYTTCPPENYSGAGTIPDPFAHLTLPALPSPCNLTAFNLLYDGRTTDFAGIVKRLFSIPSAKAAPPPMGGPVSLSPGCYNQNSPVNDDVELQPGIYIFEGGIKFHGELTVADTDTDGEPDPVIFIVLGSDGDIDINSNNGVDIRAPTSDELANGDYGGVFNSLQGDDCGPDPGDPGTVLCGGNGDGIQDWAGMLIYNATAGTNSCSTINGTSDNNFTGAIYMPNACIKFNGDATVNDADDAGCMMIVGDQIEFSGNANITTKGCGTDYNSFLVSGAIGLVE